MSEERNNQNFLDHIERLRRSDDKAYHHCTKKRATVSRKKIAKSSAYIHC